MPPSGSASASIGYALRPGSTRQAVLLEEHPRCKRCARHTIAKCFDRAKAAAPRTSAGSPSARSRGFRIAGMGNTYTDEALHIANLHPLTRAGTLTREQAPTLWKAVRKVLRDGIRRHGSSIDWIYRGGDYQKYLRVYGRTGLPCPICNTPIERMIVGQRGTHFCPGCQREPRSLAAGAPPAARATSAVP